MAPVAITSECGAATIGGKGLRERSCVFSAPKMLIIINQQENSTVTEQGGEEGEERPAGAVLRGLVVRGAGVMEVGSQRRLLWAYFESWR